MVVLADRAVVVEQQEYSEPVHPLGRVTSLRVPAAELAVIEHRGPPAEADRAYGTLASYVARHALESTGRSGSTTS